MYENNLFALETCVKIKIIDKIYKSYILKCSYKKYVCRKKYDFVYSI